MKIKTLLNLKERTMFPGKPAALIIDDGRDLLHYCERFLSDDFEFVYVQNGKEGLKVLNEREVTFVLLDQSFTGIDEKDLLGDPEGARDEGLKILQEIKESYPKMAVIMITARGDEESRRESLSLGVSEYLSWELLLSRKDFLRQLIRNLLNERTNAASRKNEVMD